VQGLSDKKVVAFYLPGGQEINATLPDPLPTGALCDKKWHHSGKDGLSLEKRHGVFCRVPSWHIAC
jgi:hypothetical protein